MPDDATPNEPLDVDAAEERLEELGEKIDSAKRAVEEDLDPNHGQRTYADSGDTPEADDQEITPPG